VVQVWLPEQIGFGLAQVALLQQAPLTHWLSQQSWFCAQHAPSQVRKSQGQFVPSPLQVLWGGQPGSHVSPQPSGPQTLPMQAGTQTQLWFWHSSCPVQTAQVPLLPQAALVSPSWQSPLASQQSGQPAHCPSSQMRQSPQSVTHCAPSQQPLQPWHVPSGPQVVQAGQVSGEEEQAQLPFA
jgi:hypothetical protein